MVDKSHWSYFWIFTCTQALVMPVLWVLFIHSLLTLKFAQAARIQVLMIVIAACVELLLGVQLGIDRLDAKLRRN